MSEVLECIEIGINEMTSKWHSILQANLIKTFYKYYDDLYEIRTELSIEIQGKEYKPDLAFYNAVDKDSIIGEEDDEIRVTELPICAVEIISPTQTITELRSKIKFYLDNGIQSAWLIIPELQTIYVFNHTFSNHKNFAIDEILKDSVLNISLNVIDIFKRTLKK